MAIIGIDLGTTNSLGCVCKNGIPTLIPNSFHSFLTPSAVSVLEDGTILVGQPAKDRKITAPGRTALSFKKDMGSNTKYQLGNRIFLPEELSAFIIQSIVSDAEKFLGEPVTEAVISVPAYFHDKQRAATKRAGALAGVKVERIVNEPSAAALAALGNDMEERKYLIFDFGGGTLDVSVISCFEHIVEIKTVAGNNRLGGDDFDTLIAEEFLKEFGLKKQKMTKAEYATLIKKARACKETLTTEESAKIQLTFDNRAYESVFNQKRLMDCSAEILQKIRTVIGTALSDAKLKANQVSDVIMVGGSSKMPMIQAYIRHLFHRPPVVRKDCDDMIALGLGVFCGIREKDPQLRHYLLTDVCPFSLGTNVVNHADRRKDLMSTIIPRNSALPCSRTRLFTTTSDMQKQVKFSILQGEAIYASDNIQLGAVEAEVTPKPAGEEKILTTFTYDINGILLVDVRVPSLGVTHNRVISETISPEELKMRIEELRAMVRDPKSLPENLELIRKLEELHLQTSPENKDTIAWLIQGFGQALESGSPSLILKWKRNIERILPQLESWDPLDIFDGEDTDWDDPWEEEDGSDDWDDFFNGGGLLS